MSAKRAINVKVTQGTVSGAEELLPSGRPFYSFKGVPYAQPPVGDLRFKAPQPLMKFNVDVLDCSEERDICAQRDPILMDYVGSEDCLFLNVYTPKIENTNNQKLPVMVWLHGGGFVNGNGNSQFYSPDFLLEEDVVVVTLNYRVGPLGFLYLPNAGVEGNAGLKDQALALKWVKENISEFCGDPDNITLFGESAGAASAQVHALNDNTKKLFNKMILQSATSLMEWVYQIDPEMKARKLAKELGCTSNDDNAILDHLKQTPALDLIRKQLKTLSPYEIAQHVPMPFRPVVNPNDDIMPVAPIELLSKQDYLNIPVMMGYNSDEGIVMLKLYMSKVEHFEKSIKYSYPRVLNIPHNGPTADSVAKEIRQFYFGNEAINEKSIKPMVNYISDNQFVLGVTYTMELHSKTQSKSPLYFYRFGFDGDLNIYKKFLGAGKVKGASHGDELFYLFKLGMAQVNVSEDNPSYKLRQKMCKMWTNFAKFGRPTTGAADNIGVEWKALNEGNSTQYLAIDGPDNLEMKNIGDIPEASRMNFWRSLFKKSNGDFIKPKL